MDKFFNQKLELFIYTVGYNIQGESVVALVKTDDIVCFSLVVDGYVEGTQNKTIDILLENKVDKIDMFCWSHPDKDHSVGLEQYKRFFDNNTSIIISDGFNYEREKWERANEIMYTFICEELAKDLRSRNIVKIETVRDKVVLIDEYFVDANTALKYSFKLGIFAPINQLILRRELLETEITNNVYSVGIYIQIGEFMALLCSDVPNIVFKRMDNRFPREVDFVKIPHHGSEGSDFLLQLIDSSLKCSSVTAFISNGLPNSSVVQRYLAKSDHVYCTRNISEKKEDCNLKKCGWGIHRFVARIDAEGYTNSVEGDAYEIQQ